MRYIATCVARAFAAFLTVLSLPALANDQLMGAWEDDSGDRYEFIAGNEFVFQTVQRVSVRDQSAPAFVLMMRNQPTHIQMAHVVRRSGVWESGVNICKNANTQGKTESGNLSLLVEKVQCCMQSRRVGKMLVLTPVGETTTSGDAAICTARGLREVKEAAAAEK